MLEDSFGIDVKHICFHHDMLYIASENEIKVASVLEDLATDEVQQRTLDADELCTVDVEGQRVLGFYMNRGCKKQSIVLVAI